MKKIDVFLACKFRTLRKEKLFRIFVDVEASIFTNVVPLTGTFNALEPFYSLFLRPHEKKIAPNILQYSFPPICFVYDFVCRYKYTFLYIDTCVVFLASNEEKNDVVLYDSLRRRNPIGKRALIIMNWMMD